MSERIVSDVVVFKNGTNVPGTPVYSKDHEQYRKRVATFTEFPAELKGKVFEMCEAGFYYTGVEDKTICFWCGGGLKHWKNEYNPWKKHARWFPSCEFVKSVKGIDFIKKVIESYVDTKVTNEKLSHESHDRCVVCMKDQRKAIFLPCGHMMCCIQCSTFTTECPQCKCVVKKNICIIEN